MPITQAYAGATTPDIAQLDASGVTYRLLAWSTGDTVRARCYAVHEQGQETLLFDNVVATAGAVHSVDSVRCVSVADQYLVVLWLDRDDFAGTYELCHAWKDVENTSAVQSWTAAAPITIDDAGLYDVKQIENPAATSEYMIAYATSGTAVQVRRVTGSIITASAWSVSVTTDHADRVLAVHADSQVANNNGGVCIVYQGTGAAANDLMMHVLDFNDGTVVGATTLIAGNTTEYAAVGIALTSLPAAPANARVGIVAEREEQLAPVVTLGEEAYVHSIVCIEASIVAFSGVLGNFHVTHNLNLLSKPYSYVDAEGDRHLYCGLGYKTVRTNADWVQFVGLICDMGLQHWGDAENTIRPRHVATYPNANVDTQPHGACPETSGQITPGGIGKRTNHISNWVPGPNWLTDTRKSRAVAWPGWRKLESDVVYDIGPMGQGGGIKVEPAGATISETIHYLEDPWTVNRDPLDYQQPDVNFHGANPLSLYANEEVQDELLIAGGTPCLYDGQAIVELGFPWNPEIVSVETDLTGTGLIGAGEYRYVAVYEWTDTRGQLHRSGPGEPFTYDAPGNEAATIIVRTMTIGSKEAAWLYPNAADIKIAIYRTNPSDPAIFRRLHASELPGHTAADLPSNDPTSWAIEVTDNINELAHGLCPPITFLDGGNGDFFSELAPMTPPAAHLVANWRNRAWLAASEEKTLWYSKENLPTAATGRIAPEFNIALRFLLDVCKGDVTGLQTLDDSLVIFTRDGIYALTGEAADALGTVGSSSLILQVLHEGTGCIEPRSIVRVPAGIIFQSYKGMYLLDKGGSLDHASTGAQVIQLTNLAGNVRSGSYLEDRHVVAFVTNSDVEDGPQVAKYDYFQRVWYTAELEPPNTDEWLSSTAGGCSWRGNERDLSHVTLCQGGLLIERGKDDTTPFLDERDDGQLRPVRIDVESGWISLAELGGVKRLYEIGIHVADSTNAIHAELDVDVDGDYSVASPEAHQWGDIDTTAAPNYCRLRPITQKLTSFRLRVYEPTMTEAADVKLIGFTARLGMKRGTRRVGDAQIGTRP